eukprot:1075592-Pelagomonas_calceolata.AAC.1
MAFRLPRQCCTRRAWSSRACVVNLSTAAVTAVTSVSPRLLVSSFQCGNGIELESGVCACMHMQAEVGLNLERLSICQSSGVQVPRRLSPNEFKF